MVLNNYLISFVMFISRSSKRLPNLNYFTAYPNNSFEIILYLFILSVTIIFSLSINMSFNYLLIFRQFVCELNLLNYPTKLFTEFYKHILNM